MATNRQFNIFLSYQRDLQDKVFLLKKFLERLNFTVWIDDEQLRAGRNLTNQLVNGIDECDLVVCCVNQQYCMSQNCKKKITYADYKRKTIIPVMFENLTSQQMDSIEHIVGPKLRVNLFEDNNVTHQWTNQIRNLIKALQNDLGFAIDPLDRPMFVRLNFFNDEKIFKFKFEI